MLTIPAKYSDTGKRARKSFKTEEAAQVEADQILGKMRDSRKIVERAGPELIEAAVEYDELFRDIYEFQGGLKEACEYLMKRIDHEERAPRFGELVDAYEEEYSGEWTNVYLVKWRWFKKAVSSLSDETTLILDGKFWTDWIRKTCETNSWSDGTANDLLAFLRCVWKHAVGVSLVKRNPMVGIRRRKIHTTEKAIYTPEQVKRLMECAWKHDREMVPFYALAIFAGLRPDKDSEITRLRWEEVDFENREICVGKRFDNKTKKRRFVRMEDNLYEWLKPWKGSTGPVTPKNITNRRRWIVRGKYQASEEAPPEEWVELVPNGSGARDITRHSYGSYFDARYHDRDKLKEYMGHNNYETYDQHYRNAVNSRDAEKFWSIVPPEENE